MNRITRIMLRTPGALRACLGGILLGRFLFPRQESFTVTRPGDWMRLLTLELLLVLTLAGWTVYAAWGCVLYYARSQVDPVRMSAYMALLFVPYGASLAGWQVWMFLVHAVGRFRKNHISATRFMCEVLAPFTPLPLLGLLFLGDSLISYSPGDLPYISKVLIGMAIVWGMFAIFLSVAQCDDVAKMAGVAPTNRFLLILLNLSASIPVLAGSVWIYKCRRFVSPWGVLW